MIESNVQQWLILGGIFIAVLLLSLAIRYIIVQRQELQELRDDKKHETAPLVSSPEMEIGSDDPPIYQKRKSLFTFQERKFYYALRRTVKNDYQIFGKVRMGDIIFLSNEPKNRKYHNNQVFCKHLDFVLCEPHRQRPVLIIELDDSSHIRYDRRKSDNFKDSASKSARLPLLRIKIQREYSERELLDQIQSKLNEEFA